MTEACSLWASMSQRLSHAVFIIFPGLFVLRIIRSCRRFLLKMAARSLSQTHCNTFSVLAALFTAVGITQPSLAAAHRLFRNNCKLLLWWLNSFFVFFLRFFYGSCVIVGSCGSRLTQRVTSEPVHSTTMSSCSCVIFNNSINESVCQDSAHLIDLLNLSWMRVHGVEHDTKQSHTVVQITVKKFNIEKESVVSSHLTSPWYLNTCLLIALHLIL